MHCLVSYPGALADCLANLVNWEVSALGSDLHESSDHSQLGSSKDSHTTGASPGQPGPGSTPFARSASQLVAARAITQQQLRDKVPAADKAIGNRNAPGAGKPKGAAQQQPSPPTRLVACLVSMLTAQPSDASPHSSEARRILTSFLNSLANNR